MRNAAREHVTSTIYGLADPGTDEIRYVGQSVHLRQRFAAHVREARRADRLAGRRLNWHRINWLRSLPECTPLLVPLEVLTGVPLSEVCDAEMRWIALARGSGVRLTNLTDGGEGNNGYVVSPELRKVFSKNSKAQFADPDARQRVSEGVRRFFADPEARARLSETMRAYYADHPQSVQTREKRAESLRAFNERNPEARSEVMARFRGVPQDPALTARRTAARLASPLWHASVEARRGTKMDPAVTAKAVATRRANGGYAVSDATRAKMRAAKVGRVLPDTHKDKIAASVRAFHAAKRAS